MINEISYLEESANNHEANITFTSKPWMVVFCFKSGNSDRYKFLGYPKESDVTHP